MNNSLFVVKNNGKISAKYATLPITSTKVQFLVEVVEPVGLIPLIKTVDYYAGVNGLKDLILAEQKEQLKPLSTMTGWEWVNTINDVELIECDLLTPKTP